MTEPLSIAVLGDVHGHLTLAYRVLHRWQRETGRVLDLILQVGDMGAYPPPFRLDDATMRFAEHDPDELGFARYYEGDDEAASILGPEATEERRIDADLVFIKGNHEDFAFLSGAAMTDGPIPVDAFSRIHYLPSGMRLHFERRNMEVRIGALGGISDDGRTGSAANSPYYTNGEVRRVQASSGIDVLITHEPPLNAASIIHPKYADQGSPHVRELILGLQPRFHFCGHYHEPGQQLAPLGDTQSWILNAVTFLKPHRLNPGCIGILTWAGVDASRFDLVDAPWLSRFTRSNYKD